MDDAVYAILLRVLEGELSLSDAAETLGVHRTTLWRKLQRISSQGHQGLTHRLSGKPSNRRLPEGIRASAVALFRDLAGTQGVSLVAVHRALEEKHEASPSYATLKRWLREEGLLASVPRPRLRVIGANVLLRRFGHRIAAVDCSNGGVLACTDRIDYAGVRDVLAQVIERYGLPMRIIADRATLALFTAKDKRHFREACDRLGIAHNKNVPQHLDIAEIADHLNEIMCPPEARVGGTSVFVRPANERWRALLQLSAPASRI
jgi:hypothetical protein